MKPLIPERTVERLSLYRRVLLNYQYLDHAYIYSHNLARFLKTNAATVRRDLMLIGVEGDVHKGYVINELVEKISTAIDPDNIEKVAFVGIGELGRAVHEYFNQNNTRLQVAATFRFGNQIINQVEDIPCYNMVNLPAVINRLGIRVCVVAVTVEYAKEISTILAHSGVLGILNFSSALLQLPDHIYVENYDMITKLEKIAYFMNRPVK